MGIKRIFKDKTVIETSITVSLLLIVFIIIFFLFIKVDYPKEYYIIRKGNNCIIISSDDPSINNCVNLINKYKLTSKDVIVLYHSVQQWGCSLEKNEIKFNNNLLKK